MPNLLKRRMFLAITGGALAVPSALAAQNDNDDDDVPALLDHILLGCASLESGIDAVEKELGVRPEPGGVHPGRGTRNALLSLGERRYLEIIAPDDTQRVTPVYPELYSLREPRLIGWAVHPPDIAAVAKQLTENKVAFKGPTDGSRTRPDGTVLNWKTINLADDHHGLLPFFIQWGANTVHPSKNAPKGCTLDYFEVMAIETDELSAAFKRAGLDIPVARSDKPRLHAMITGPKGDLGLTS
jgi:Glyoxalase-like domain